MERLKKKYQTSIYDYRIRIFSCYFGTLPEHFDFWKKSVGHNSTVDFVFVTDTIVNDPPPNMLVISSSFESFKCRIQSLFDFTIILDRPYKLCDYKPVWGLAFPELLDGYDFWGYCDIDMIFGDIRGFISDTILEQYDKIYMLGHLTLYRNTNENNERYKLDGGVFYKEAFTTTEITAFDEIAGMQNIFDKHGFKTYFVRDYADITYSKVRFTLSDFHVSPRIIAINNYREQVFYWKEGKIYRAFIKNGEILNEEFVYIHFSKRKMPPNDVNIIDSAFYITKDGLRPMFSMISKDDIIKHNKSSVVSELKRSSECKINYAKNQFKYYYSIFKSKIIILIKFGTSCRENYLKYIKNR